MEGHASHSYDVIVRVPGLERIADLARHHRERGDGRGYPDGIGGRSLPLAARILGVADVFQALTQQRAYRPGKDRTEVRETLGRARQSGWLDGTALDALEARFDEYWSLSTGPLELRGLAPGLAALCLDGEPEVSRPAPGPARPARPVLNSPAAS